MLSRIELHRLLEMTAAASILEDRYERSLYSSFDRRSALNGKHARDFIIMICDERALHWSSDWRGYHGECWLCSDVEETRMRCDAMLLC